METASSALGLIRKGDVDVLDRPQGCLFSDSHPSGFSFVLADSSSRKCLPFLGSLLWPFHGSPEGIRFVVVVTKKDVL